MVGSLFGFVDTNGREAVPAFAARALPRKCVCQEAAVSALIACKKLALLGRNLGQKSCLFVIGIGFGSQIAQNRER